MKKNWLPVDKGLHKEHGNSATPNPVAGRPTSFFVGIGRVIESYSMVARIWWAREHEHAVQDLACYFRSPFAEHFLKRSRAAARQKKVASEDGGPALDK